MRFILVTEPAVLKSALRSLMKIENGLMPPQMKSLDFEGRHAGYIETVSVDIMQKALRLTRVIIS